MNKKGFTLIELLVVISIIGVLSGVVLQSLNAARVKARNVARLENANAIATGFYLATTGTTNKFPITNVHYCLGKESCWDDFASYSENIDNLLKKGMVGGIIPLDPFWKTGQIGDAFLYYADTDLSYISWAMEGNPDNEEQSCGRGIESSLETSNGYICDLYFYSSY